MGVFVKLLYNCVFKTKILYKVTKMTLLLNKKGNDFVI